MQDGQRSLLTKIMLNNMRKPIYTLALAAIVVLFSSSCKTGEGCPGEQNWQKSVEMSEKKSKPKSGLWDKKTKKRMGR